MKLHPSHGDIFGSFAREEYDRRFERARELMRASDIDAFLISQHQIGRVRSCIATFACLINPPEPPLILRSKVQRQMSRKSQFATENTERFKIKDLGLFEPIQLSIVPRG